MTFATLDPRRYRVLYISDSRLTPGSFYGILLEQLGVIAKWGRSEAKKQLHEQVSILKAVDDIDTVCVVDEAHLLSFEMLEEIRFLLNVRFDSTSPVALIAFEPTDYARYVFQWIWKEYFRPICHLR